ncbi:MAG: threonine synthase [Bacillota bacterium]|nr:threonine synthase [Bacillota bacterium]
MTYISHLECPKCQRSYAPFRPNNTCQCGAPLLVRYDLDDMGRGISRREIKKRPPGMWRYREFLPVAREENIVSLGEGSTPMLTAGRLGKALGLEHLQIKDEGLNPTGTFKSRGASCGISRCKELGIGKIAMPTAGHAGGAWSCYAARAGIEAFIAMPVDAERVAMLECVLSGAKTWLVRGLISDAGRMISKAAAKYEWFDVATLKEPYRIEGKKTMGLEIAEDFDWGAPDVVIYPTGGGVGLIGIWKAYQELIQMGWVKDKPPKLVAVQAEGCMPIVRAYQEGKESSEFHTGAKTFAGGIRVPKALGDFLVLQAIRETGGTAVAVSDEEIMEGVKLTALTEGMFICPEGGAAIAAARRLVQTGYIQPEDKVVILNTGAGIKYPDIVRPELPVLNPDEEIVL